MSTILAIKKNGRIYMAADTQTSCNDRKLNYLGEESRKIRRLENGILLAHTGSVHNAQILFAHSEIFTVPEDGVMTKKYVVQNIIPKMFKCYRENRMCEKEEGEPPKMGDSYLLVYKDKMFLIEDVFAVEVLDHYAAIGSGGELALGGLMELDSEEIQDGKEIEERLVELLRISASRMMSVSGPYCLIDSVEQTNKIVY